MMRDRVARRWRPGAFLPRSSCWSPSSRGSCTCDARSASIYRRVLALEEHLAAVTEQHLSRHFRQVEALVGLHAVLRPDRDLPETRGWAASPDFLLGLVAHAMATKPRVIVECGQRRLHRLAGSMPIPQWLGPGPWPRAPDQTFASGRLESLTRRWCRIVGGGPRCAPAGVRPPFGQLGCGTAWASFRPARSSSRHAGGGWTAGDPGPTRALSGRPAPLRTTGEECDHLRRRHGASGRADHGRSLDRRHPDLVQEIRACEKGCVILRRCPR